MVQSRSKVSKGGKCGKGKGKGKVSKGGKVGKGAKGKGAKGEGKFYSREVGDIKPKNNNR